MQKSEKIEPTDVITLRNMAGTYELMKNEKKTLEYLEKIIKHGNTEQRKEARELIEMVKNKYKE